METLTPLIIVLLLVGAVEAQSIINPNQCVDRTGGLGETVDCPSGYVAVGFCSSREYNCRDSANIAHTSLMKCCRVIEQTRAQTPCTIREGSWGEPVSCPTNQAVVSGCSSGGLADCSRYGVYTRTMCCDGPTLGINIIYSDCHYNYGNIGLLAQCSANQVMTELCTSGTRADCFGYWTRIRCCAVTAA